MRRNRNLPGHPRRAATLVELLVVIAILGLLAAISIPAVQQVRGSARRMTCQNHLRQVGVAIAAYEENYGTFPTAETPEPALWRLLPYFDAASIRDALVAMTTPAAFHVPVLACPDDPVVHVNMATGDSSYFLNDGTRFRHSEHNGFRKSPTQDTRPNEVTDGLSQTVAISERLVQPGGLPRPSEEVMIAESRRYFWWTESAYRGPGQEAAAIEQCRHHRTTVLPQFFGMNANNFRHGGPSYDHLLPPNHIGCYNGPEEDFALETESFLIPASSLHPGGINSLMADGSVHFVNEKIDAAVWQALGTRNGRETVTSPFGR